MKYHDASCICVGCEDERAASLPGETDPILVLADGLGYSHARGGINDPRINLASRVILERAFNAAIGAVEIPVTVEPSGPPPVLPTDSAERKLVPVCTGCVDYFPATIENLIAMLMSGEEWSGSDSNDAFEMLAARGDQDAPWATTRLAQICLDMLQDELCGPPTQCRPRQIAERWGAALTEVARISKAGNDKHNPGEPLHHARGKSMDHPDCIARHLVERGGYDGKFRHTACLAWRAMALDQEEAERLGAPLARGAWLPDGTKGSDRYEPDADLNFGAETSEEGV